MGKLLSFRNLVAATFAVVLGCGLLATASAKASEEACGLTYLPSELVGATSMNSPGLFRAYFWTDKSNCDASYVETWIENASQIYCGFGSTHGGDHCYKTSTTGRADATVSAWGCGQTWAGGFHSLTTLPYFAGGEQRSGVEGEGYIYLSASCYEPDPGCTAEFDEVEQVWFSNCGSSPIIIPVGKDQSFRLTNVGNGVNFDLNNDGIKERLSWTDPRDDLGFLAIDRNGDGRIDSGYELLGNHTVPGVQNGFLALAELQFQESGVRRGDISLDDPLYTKLLLWQDRNHNGESEPEELSKFSEKFSAIGLSYNYTHRKDGFGNEFRYEGYVKERTKPGRNHTESGADSVKRHRKVYDVFFVSE